MKNKIKNLENIIINLNSYITELIGKLYVDKLTQIYNRTYLEEVEINKWKNNKCYIYFIDVNGLKHINDTRGHVYGDTYLKKIAQELHFFGNVIRYGGDEFIIFSKNKISKLITNQKYSVGIYIKNNNFNIEKAIRLADINMYKNKNILYKKGKYYE